MRFKLAVGLGALLLLGAAGAHAAPPPNITQTVGVCDPNYPKHCAAPSSAGVLPVSISGGGGGIGTVAIPNIAGGSSDGTTSGNPQPWYVDVGGLGHVQVSNPFNLEATQLLVKADLDALTAAIGTAIPAGTALIGHTDGAGAAAASLAGNPNRTGCRAATADPTAVTDAQLVDEMCGATGKRIVLPYAIKELAVRGSTGAVTNTTQTSIIASAGGSLRNYITAIQCSNSGATTSILTFTDSASTVLINPAGGGGSWTFPVPLATAAATAFQVTPGSSSTSQYCSAQGYTGL